MGDPARFQTRHSPAVETPYTVGSTIRLDSVKGLTSTFAEVTHEDSDGDYLEDDPEESSSFALAPMGTDHQPKWWHVPDEKIDQLIKRVGQSKEDHSKTRSKRGKLAVTFDEPPEDDALDRMLRSTQEKFAAREKEAPEDEQLDKWWKVSDEKLMDLVLRMGQKSVSSDALLAQSGKSSFGKSTSSSARSLQKHRAAGGRRKDERLIVQIFFLESGDTLTLRVPPDMRLGPAKSPKLNCFTQVFGQGASTKGFDKQIRSFDYGKRQFGTTQREQWSPEWTTSLKSFIYDITKIEPSRQRLFHRSSPMTSDDMSLASYGIQDWEVLSLQIQKWTPGANAQKDVFLACTKRKRDMVDQRNGTATASLSEPRYDGYTLRDNKDIRKYNRADSDIWMMPRWISQSCPNLFAPVGVGLDGDGGMKVKKDFASIPIYLPDANDSKLSRVREAVTGHQQYMKKID